MRHEAGFRTEVLSLTRLPGLAAGTRVLTPEGEVAVEQLQSGDRVVTRNGRARLHAVEARAARVAPICILAEALAPGYPVRDVVLGPATRLFLPCRPLSFEAFRLADGTVVTEQAPRGMTLWTLAFRQPEVITVEGVEVWA